MPKTLPISGSFAGQKHTAKAKPNHLKDPPPEFGSGAPLVVGRCGHSARHAPRLRGRIGHRRSSACAASGHVGTPITVDVIADFAFQGRFMRVDFRDCVYASSVLLAVALSGPALAGSLDPSSPMERGNATPHQIDFTEGSGPVRTLEKAVMFAVGSAQLSKRAEADLTRLAKEIEKVQVVVIGRDDDSQTEGLAEARAHAMSEVLTKAGVPAVNMTKRLEPQTAERGGKEGAWLVASHVRWTSDGTLMQPAPASSANPVVPINSVSSDDRKLIQRLVAKGSISQAQADVALRAGFRSVQVSGVPLRSSFDVLATDGDVSATLRRWGEAYGYKISWEAGAPAPVTGDLTLNAKTFLEALSQVVGGLQNAGYPIKAQTLANNQVRITVLEKQ